MRALFHVTTHVAGADGRVTVELHAVDPYVDDDGSEHPNKGVWKESPSGAITMHTTQEAVSEFFAYGREFAVEFTPLDAAAG
jgi:hypothetical protein